MVSKQAIFLIGIMLIGSFISAQDMPLVDSISLEIKSNPDSVRIAVSGISDTFTTPISLKIKSLASTSMAAFKEGFDTLFYDLKEELNRDAVLNFVLKPEKPRPLTALDYGFEYGVLLPLEDESKAKRLRQKYINASEIFLITPFTQGLIGKIVLGNDDDGTADALMISGAVLTLGSYFLGKILSSKKQRKIIEYNQYAEEENRLITENNDAIDKEVKLRNQDMMATWQKNAKNTGVVLVTYR